MLLVLASCDSGPDNGKLAEAEAELKQSAQDDGKIECALAGADRFDRICTQSLVYGPEGRKLTLYGPEGGFRRFDILEDGSGLQASDGFERPEIVVLDSNLIEVTIGDDKYRLPARIKNSDTKDKGAADGEEAGTAADPAVEGEPGPTGTPS